MLKDRVIAELRYIINGGGDQYIKTINEVNSYFISLMGPKNLDGGSNKNVIVQFQLNFHELCIALMANGVPDPELMTVFRFYTALKYFENKKSKATNEQKS